MSGARETLMAQASNSNNLANATTPGFLADLHHFRSMPVYGDGHPSRVYGMGERSATDDAYLEQNIKPSGTIAKALTAAQVAR